MAPEAAIIIAAVEQLTEQVQAAPSLPPSATTPATVRLEPRRGLIQIQFRELWSYRDLARQLAVRDITVRYRQTALGAAWAILQPAGIMLVFTLAFGNLAHVSSEGAPYALFALTGLVPWTFFANTLTVGSDSLVTNSQMLSKIYFPRIFLPLGVMAASMVDFVISFVIMLAVVLIDGRHPGLGLLALPLLVAIMVSAALGISATFAAVHVRFRDVKYAIPFTVQFWLFATPLAYPITLLHEPWRTLLAINPMVGVVEGFRWAVLDSRSAPWGLIAVSGGSALLCLVFGLAYFGRVERRFADIV